MPALRFLLLGYGMATVLGVGAGAHVGPLWGLVIVWLGGAVLSLLLAYCWFRAETRLSGRAVGPVPEQGCLLVSDPKVHRLFRAWDRDLAAESKRDAETLRGSMAGGRARV